MKTLFVFHGYSKTIFIESETLFKLGNYKVTIKRSSGKDTNIQIDILAEGEFNEVPIEVEEALIFLKEFLNFVHGDFKISRGLDIFTKIPDNDEEKARLGDTPHGCVMRVEEMPNPVNINVELLNKIDKFYPTLRLISQFNAGNASSSPIAKYLNYFKIIEDSYYKGKGKLKECLKAQQELIKIIEGIEITRKDPKDPTKKKKYKFTNSSQIIEDMVDLRDNCAHLRTKNNFGYAESDIRSLSKLSEYSNIVRCITLSIISELFDNLNKSQ